MVASKPGLMGIRCPHNHNPLKVSSIAKPRTGEASMEDKAQKQASIDMQMGDPNPLIWAKLYG